MIIAHAPAGYIVTTLFNKTRNTDISFWKWGLLFSIWPDFDLIVFYFIDHGQLHHHFYFPHIPFLLLIAILIIIPLKLFKVKQQILNVYYLFVTSWFIHLILDTVAGDVPWLFPFSREMFCLFPVPAQYSHWVISFILHWTFLFEIGIICIAVILAIMRFKSKTPQHKH